MAKINQETNLDLTNKMSLGVASTTNDKNYFEETLQWLPSLDKRDIFAEIVPSADNPTSADLVVTNNPSLVSKLTDYILDEIPSSNGQGYSAYDTPGNTNSTRLSNMISPQKFGNGYAFILKDNSNTIIPLTLGSYQFDYKNGILRFSNGSIPADLGWATPLKLTCYRYIGNMLSDETSASVNDSWRQPVKVLDNSSTSLTGWSIDPTIDGVSILNGDDVLFTGLSLGTENNRKYTWDNSALIWTIVEDGQNSNGSPIDGDKIVIKEGTYQETTFNFNGTEWVETSSFNLNVGESDGTPLGSNINTLLLCPGNSDNVFIDGTTAYLHAPPAPDTIEIENTIVEFEGRLSQSNINYGTESAGNSIDYISRPTDIPTSNTFTSTNTSFNNASIGLLTVNLNGSVIATLDLGANFNETNRLGAQTIADYDIQGAGDSVIDGVVNFTGGYLQIESVEWSSSIGIDDYQSGKFVINITSTALLQGYNTIHVEHNSNSTNVFKIFNDIDTGNSPIISVPDLSVNTLVSKHISGVSYCYTGTVFDLDCTISNAFNNVYHNSNAPITLVSNFGVSENIYYTDLSVTGVTNPPKIGEIMVVENKKITVIENQENENALIFLTPRDPYGSYVMEQTPEHNIMIMSIPNSSDRVSEFFTDETYRFPLVTDFNILPGGITGNWDSTNNLGVNDLQVYDIYSTNSTKSLIYPHDDYSNNVPNSNPDYTSLSSGTNKEYVRVLQGIQDNSNGIFTIYGINESDIGTNVNIYIKVPTKTVWMDISKDYVMGTFEENVRYVHNTWTASTDYNLNDWILPTVPNGYKYKCTTNNGTSDIMEPTWNTIVGGTTIDGLLVWTCSENVDNVGCRINSDLHSLDIDHSINFTLGTFSSDNSVNHLLFLKIVYSNSAIPRVIGDSISLDW